MVERRIGRILRIGLVYLWRITRKVDSGQWSVDGGTANWANFTNWAGLFMANYSNWERAVDGLKGRLDGVLWPSCSRLVAV